MITYKTQNRIQPRLKIGQTSVKYENQADRVGDSILKMSDHSNKIQHSDGENKLHMQTTEEELHMKPNNSDLIKMEPSASPANQPGFAPAGVSQKINSSKGSGQKMPSQLNQEMSQKMGTDFSNVSIHRGKEASSLNNQIGARAFTHGNDIYFNSGEYKPSSSDGKHLLAHELTHILQQNRNLDSQEKLPGHSVSLLSSLPGEWVSRQTDSTEEVESVNTSYCNRPLAQNEVNERNRILEDFTRGLPDINESVRRVFIASICDFSLTQLNMMKEAGFRFWMGNGVPPVFEGDVRRDAFRGSASYTRQIRTAFLGNRVNPGYVTHEMAHAWDHIRNLPARRRVRLDDISNRSRRRSFMNNAGQYLTATRRRQDIQIDGRTRQMSFNQMHSAYTSRVIRRELAFRSNSTEGYSMTNPQEFYAEGYSVFHGNSVLEQAKLYKYARELYAYLLSEAREQQMPVPDNEEVRREAQRLPSP